MIAYPVYQDVPYEVSVFLKTKPQIFAVLEIMVAIVMISFIIVQDYFLFFLASPAFFILTGFVIILAACKRNLCVVKTAQAFNYINIVVISISFRFHLVFNLGWDITWYVLLAGDVLVLIFSVVVASTSCSCCCRPKSRSYMSATVPVNNIVVLDQSVVSTSPHPVSSVTYVLPGACGQMPYAPPPNYGPVTSVPPPYYSLVPTAPPPAP